MFILRGTGGETARNLGRGVPVETECRPATSLSASAPLAARCGLHQQHTVRTAAQAACLGAQPLNVVRVQAELLQAVAHALQRLGQSSLCPRAEQAAWEQDWSFKDAKHKSWCTTRAAHALQAGMLPARTGCCRAVEQGTGSDRTIEQLPGQCTVQASAPTHPPPPKPHTTPPHMFPSATHRRCCSILAPKALSQSTAMASSSGADRSPLKLTSPRTPPV